MKHTSSGWRIGATATLIGAAALLAHGLGARGQADEPAGTVKPAGVAPPVGIVPKDEIPRPHPVPTPPPAELEASIRRGVAFLLARQNANGSWGSHQSSRPSEIFSPLPETPHAFRAAVTAMCVSALIEVGGDSAEVARSIDRGETWLLEHLKALRRNSGDCLYNNWSHAYAIQALSLMLKRKPADSDRCRKIRELIEHQVGMLGRYECLDGGWCYYDFTNQTQRPSGSTIGFVTATVLVALDEARKVGIEAPKPMIDRAKASILRQRNPDFSYHYGEYLKYQPRRPINRPAGSLGRSQACNLAMRLWGDTKVTDQVVRDWLDRLFARNLWLDMGRKRPIPHESWCQVAGYFFYYGHYYAALCIEQLPEAQRGPYRDHLAQVLMHLQEKDGSWWDFPFYDYHQQYGTAFALMSLGHCRRSAPASK